MKRKAVLLVLLMAMFMPLAMNAQGLTRNATRPTLRAADAQPLAIEKTSQTRDRDGWLQYDNGSYATSIGNSTAYDWTWAVMYPASMLGTNNTLSMVSIYNTSYNVEDITIDIYQGGDTEPGTLVATQVVTPTSGWQEVSLTNPVTIDPSENLWIVLTEHGTYVLTACQTNEPNNQWVENDGWYNIGDLASSLAPYGWMIRAYVEYYDPTACPKPTNLVATDVTPHAATLSWRSAEGITEWQVVYSTEEGFNPDNADPIDVGQNPYTLNNLTDVTTYYAHVRAICDKDDYSEWSNVVMFTTPSACATPFDLEASDISFNSATLSWNGYQDSYTVRYKPVVFYDDFENGLSNWTIYTEGEAPQEEGWYPVNPIGGLSFEAHSGSYAASSWSWNSTAFNADNWLVTPQLPLDGTLRFFVRTNPGYPDSYEVLLSTAGNGTTDFTTTLQAMAPAPDNGEWNEVVIDLSTYNGQQGYIAIHHVSYDMNYLLIDDFVIESSEWITLSNVVSPCALADLTAGTSYMAEVQGNCVSGQTEWSEWIGFTTTEMCQVPSGLEATDITASSATLNWTGAQESYNVRYRVAATDNIILFADFENGLPEGWTTIDNDGDGFGWMSSVGAGSNCHSGSGCMVSASFDGDSQEPLTPDNWLITPLVDFGGTMRVWLCGQDPEYVEEHYAIYLSTSGNSVSDFTITLKGETIATENYVECVANLNRYAGQSGYIAIRHFNCTDMFYLNVDDFGIYGDEIPAGEWVEVTGATSPLTIEPLVPETEYEWQVQGINPNCDGGLTEWSDMDNFTTLTLCVAPTDLDVTAVTHNSATLDWTGDQDSYNVRYRTAGYNEVLLYDSFENGVSSWTQSDGSIYSGIPYDGTYMYLFWGDAEPQYLITPELSGLDEGGYVLFYHRYYQAEMTFKVGYSSTTADIRSFEWSDEITSGSSYAYYIDLVPEGTKYIAIQSTGTNSDYALLVDYFVVFGPDVPAGEWVEVNGVTNPLTIEPLIPDTEYEWQVQGITSNCPGGLTEWTEGENFITGSGLIFITDGNWNNGANWYFGEVPADYSDVIVNANAIIPADYDAKVNSVTFGEGGSITIKDGGQLHSNATVQATVEKEIVGYGEGDANYYLIANPLNSSVNPGNTSVGLTNGDYDLYGFDANEEENEWRNYKADPFTLGAGFGYLYANSEDVTLQFTGTLRKQYTNLFYNGNALNYDENNTNLNWNLVGNMFGHNGYVYIGAIEDGYVVYAEDQYFYKMNEAGTDIIASNDVVKPCEGIFVQATDTAQYAFISAAEHNVNAKGLDMRLVQDDNLIDVVLIRFGEGRGLEKFQLNPNHTKVFMTEGDKDYSVLFTKENGMMPVSFKAEKEGSYTLSFIPQEITYSYLHLIDTLTGAEVDLLVNPEYTFETNAGDFAKRFTIVYEVK